jgi:hypothetical protein
MPRAAAARSLVRTAISRRPARPRRRFATATATTANETTASVAKARGAVTVSSRTPNSRACSTTVPSVWPNSPSAAAGEPGAGGVW